MLQHSFYPYQNKEKKKRKIDARTHNRQTTGNKAGYRHSGERELSIRKLIFVSDMQQQQQITRLCIAH